MHRAVYAIVCAALSSALISPTSAAAAAGADSDASYQQLQTLAKDMTFTYARIHPLTATGLGIAGHDGDVDAASEGARNDDIALIASWQGRLAKIQSQYGSSMTLVDRDDMKLLGAQLIGLARQYSVYQTDRKDYAGPANSIVGAIFTQFQHLPIVGQNGATAATVGRAWDDITSRLEKAPSYIVAAQALVTKPGHLYGIVGSQELAGVADFFDGALTDAAKAQMSSDKFKRFTIARDKTVAVMAATKKYIDAHVTGWPENYAMGRANYDALLHDEQLLPYDSSDVVRMGYDELNHGWAVRFWLEHLSQITSTPFGPKSGGGMAPGGPALVDYYRARIADLRRFVTEKNVVTVPSWLGQIKVVETPKFLQPVSPGASMNPPRQFSPETDGYYFITPPTSLAEAARTLDPNQDFDRDRIWSTGAHEAMPGHFLQLSIARRHPDFVKKIQGSGVFAEGWAFYGEEMFVQLGLYGDDLDGRYYTAQWERVRGARAIVDPMLASGEWSFRQAADFFAEQTGFPKAAADAAVAGIALGPGYVISYTVGRNQLEALETQYRIAMGSHATMLDFHDRLLCYGTTPFAVVGPELMADLHKPLAEVRKAANY
ncbi:MAG TPA: DUF885 family protein [Candidatus Eremiobacteraceae bacterium]|nr:DUF885 family protein [Candidatus Eremiobacteraceae bacterium]